MTKKSIYHKLLSLLLCFALLLPYLPITMVTAVDNGRGLELVANSKVSDPSTLNGWEAYFGPGKMDTEFAGAVWTDKSVFTAATTALPGISLTDSNNFLVALSAIASNLSIKGHTSVPTDTMLVLDVSGSMVDNITTVGYVRRGNNYGAAEVIDMSLINAMVEATNATIKALMEQNTNNRVGVVLYSGNSSTNQDADYGDATVVLPLGRYTDVSGEYLSVDTTWQTNVSLYEYIRSGRNGYWQATGETATYVAKDTPVYVETVSGLKTEAGATVSAVSKYVNGGTYIQNGLYKAMEQFLAVEDTTVPEGKAQEGAERMPVIVLMSDGAPTIATTDYADTKTDSSNTGNGGSTSNRITFLTQLTAAYVRGKIAAHYKENSTDEAEALFLTLGLGTENSTAATDTLYPAGSDAPLTTYWSNYLAGAANTNVNVGDGLTVARKAEVAAMNYVDKYFYASNAQGLVNSFEDILGEIELKAASYTTLVEGSSADYSGYVTFEDELGELMQVYNMSGILLGNTLFTGRELAKGMSEYELGDVGSPNERGNELIATVKERITGTTTTQAQQLLGNAYNDKQLYYTDDNNWSNYIGWYADADGKYVGFWDKDSGYTNAPAGAVYANKSYAYLGVNGNSDMMHIVVMVRTELATRHQTVLFKIPAALLPTVQYKVTLGEDDPSQVSAFTQESADPIRLVFEVGVREDINSVNMEQKIAEHIQKGGHVHRNNDGTVTFYTNEWAIGNDQNGNRIPDADEVDSAIVAQSHFHPALDNSRFYYTEDTVIYTGNGSPVTGSDRPTDTDSDTTNGTGYYYNRYIYNQSGRVTKETPIAATTLANDAKYDTANNRWYVPAGTMYHDLSRFSTSKTSNSTDTLYYSFFPAVFDSVGKQDVYAFLGNNGTITVAPATGIVLSKQVQGTIAGVSQYTFKVTLSNIPAGTTAAPKLTNANGDTLSGVTMSDMSSNAFTVTMPAGVDAYISGIPAGTNVTVEEQINGDYKVVGIKVAGADQSGSASFTVPAYTEAGPSQMVPVTFTNAPNGYGDLVITKDVHHELASDPAELAKKEFTFHVTLTGDKLKKDDTFTTSKTGTTVTVPADGSVTFEVKLHNEESITVYRLPEGTSYTVEEINIPEGFTVNQNNLTGEIAADRSSTAGFINTYPDEFHPVSIPLNITVTKNLIDEANAYQPDPNDGDFVFVLQRLLDNGTYPSIEYAPNNAYLKIEATGSGTATYPGTATWNLSFDNIGTYYYRVVELKPSEQDPAKSDTDGMTYSTTNALFAIIVTDDDMDGNLEVTVREEAHVTASTTYTDSNTEKPEKIDVAASFTNTYIVGSTNAVIPVHKVLTNNTGVNIPLTRFQFGLYEMKADGTAGDLIQTVTTSALGDAAFNILITEDNDPKYIIKEIIPAEATLPDGKYVLNGLAYDSSEYVLEIAVSNVSGQLKATPTLTLKDSNSSTDVALFENTYTLTPVYATIPISKSFTGRDLLNGESYWVKVEATNDTFVPDTGIDSGSYKLPVNSGTVSVALPLRDQGFPQDQSLTFVYNKVGSYHYRFTEKLPVGLQPDPVTGQYTKDGVIYDTAEYHITVTVSDNGDGTLAAKPTIHKVGQTAAVDAVSFTNTYTVSGEGKVTIGGKKVLDGRRLAAGEFTIGLYSDANCTDLIESTTNNADGTFSFSGLSELHFTAANLNKDSNGNYIPTTVTYYVKEILPEGLQPDPETGKYVKNGITYDTAVHTVTVAVSHENGVLTVTPSDNATSLQITNTYKADDVTATINGTKVLSGDWSKVPSKSFSFSLYKADASFNITDQTPVKTVHVNGSGNFSIGLTYIDGEEGYHYYVLKENIPDPKAGGVGYDAGEYHISINVTDPGSGKLASFVRLYRPGTGNTETAVFTNAYAVEPTTVTLTGKKSFVDTTTGQPITMKEGDFSFLVLEGDSVVATGYNQADGTIQFTEIQYTAPGVHTYTVVEDPGQAGGVIYDETKFTVTVTVTDNGNGTLSTAVNYNGKDVVFENKYAPQSAQVTLNGSKKLNNKALEADKFTFWLYATDSTFATTGLTPVEKSNAADGSFTFGTLTFDKAGTYYYRVVEKNAGQTIQGITYSEAFYNITVVVTDDGNGKLIPTVTVSDPKVTVNTTVNVATVNGLNFENTYTAKPATYTPKAEKEYKGDDMKTFEFVLSGEGFAQQTKQNGSDGKVTFDALTFDRAGNYTFTIREQENLLWGFIRWDVNVYKLTVKVIDDGAGQLKIDSVTVTSTLGTDDLVFRNVHEDLITKKDVFLSSAPTVSINGKKVQVGDELLYTISYTNYTGKAAAQVTITDTLPASIAYVYASADKGGSFADGKVTWTLTNVAAGETVTVSFRGKVVNTETAVVNTATVADDENTYTTNEVVNPVTNDEMVKNVYQESAPTVSIDGQKVSVGDVLVYTITYKNGDDQAAKVTVTDTISQYTAYVEGSADNGGVFADGKVTWTLELAAGESKTVSFKVTVKNAGATIQNQAEAFDGTNKLESNTVTSYTPAPPATPQTGDEMNLILWLTLLLISAAGMAVLMVSRKRLFR